MRMRSEGDSAIGLFSTYGPDRQRAKTVLKNGSVQQTRIYADNYECRTIGGTTQHIYYICSPDGLVGVYVQSGSSGKLYVAQTDNLGNILRLYDNSGTIAYRATYDPWGRRTVATNTINFRRGFTGHEHWDEFALIDMNGRMYDPLIGRFLSPDPYVQAPTNSQNFNRYSYCLNNPLKYTDPSGEWILTWNLGNSGFSLGINFAPLPMGFGVNFDWSDGFSLGTYGEFGIRLGGNGLGTGIYTDQGFNYNCKHKEWSTFASEGAYASAFCFTIGGSYNQAYNFNTREYHDIWCINSGLGWGNGISGYSLGMAYSSGSNGGIGLSIGGNYVYSPNNPPKYINETTYSTQLKDGIPTQSDSEKYCYAYALAYADAGHGNHDAQYFINAADGAYGADMEKVAKSAGIKTNTAGAPKNYLAYETLGCRIQAGYECYGAINQDGKIHYVNITSITTVDKRRFLYAGYKRVVKSTTIWNPVGGHMRGPLSFIKIGTLF